MGQTSDSCQFRKSCLDSYSSLYCMKWTWYVCLDNVQFIVMMDSI